MTLENELQNKLSAAIVALIGLFAFLSQIMPQIKDPVEIMISQLPPGLQTIATGIVGVVLIVVFVWNYTSSIEHAADQNVAGKVEAIEQMSLNPNNSITPDNNQSEKPPME